MTERSGDEIDRDVGDGPDDDRASEAGEGNSNGSLGESETALVADAGDVDPSILHLSPAEREARGITDDDVRETFDAVVTRGTAEQKDLRGVSLPELSLDRRTVESVDRHPVDLSGATIEGLSLEYARVALPFVLDGATIGSLRLDEAHVEASISCSDATVTGPVSCFEARFDDDVAFDGTAFEGPVDCDEATFRDDVRFDGTAFEGPVDCDEATFRDDVRFDGATFADEVTFRAAECHGDSNHLEDNTTFSGATFRAPVSFRETEFGFTRFDAVDFDAEAVFQEATFTGDTAFDGTAFDALADFDEVRFESDTAFDDVAFRGRADFRGASFSGGARTLVDDASFAGATFADDAAFDHASFRYVTFADAAFAGTARFESVTFDGDADFPDAEFTGEADFDEARFREDADFSSVRFDGPCTFRGCEFAGGANHLKDDLSFAGARFAADVDFHDAEISAANFEATGFGGTVDFSNCAVSERIDMAARGLEDDAFVDFTRAKLPSGRIVQPAEGWVRYDLTLASIGDVVLEAEREPDRRQLLDYFRFCRTEFDEFDGHTFDFSGHREYLDRNAWTIHAFDEPAGGDPDSGPAAAVEAEPAADGEADTSPDDEADAAPDYALEMTPAAIEVTYLKAKQSAQDVGDMKTAGEFRVKRQQYSRQKNLEVVRDPEAGLWARTKNLGRAAENFFLGVTCGHGMRPMRIGIAFAVAPLVFAIPYTVGGSLFETEAESFAENLYFSYISYTTIGYGDLSPAGPLARLLAASEAYLSTILAALLVYALVKRSEL